MAPGEARPVRVLVDTNVVLDVVLAREPWVPASAAVLSAAAEGRIEGFVAGHTVTTVHYVTAANRDRRAARAAVVELLDIFDVVPAAESDFHRALALELADFEYAVQAACALRADCDLVVTRDDAGFDGAGLLALSPGAFVARLDRG